MRLQEIIDQRAEEKKPEWIAQERKRWQKQVAIGEKRGEKRGISIGSHERAVATARRALMRGFTPDVVAELTGLSVEEVRALL